MNIKPYKPQINHFSHPDILAQIESNIEIIWFTLIELNAVTVSKTKTINVEM